MPDLDVLTQTVLLDLRNIYYGLQGVIALKNKEFLDDIEKSLNELKEKSKPLEYYKKLRMSEHLEFIDGLINRLKAEDYNISKEDITLRLRELDGYLPRIY